MYMPSETGVEDRYIEDGKAGARPRPEKGFRLGTREGDVSGLYLCLGPVRQENAAGEWSGNIFRWIKSCATLFYMCLRDLSWR